jgi:hypothetical protein
MAFFSSLWNIYGYLSQYSDRPEDGKPRMESQLGEEIDLFSTGTKLALGHTQPPIQWVLGPLSSVVQWPGHEAGHSSPSSAQDKNGGAILHSTICLHGTVLN